MKLSVLPYLVSPVQIFGLGTGTPAAGTRKVGIVSSTTQNPCPHVEYGRISAN